MFLCYSNDIILYLTFCLWLIYRYTTDFSMYTVYWAVEQRPKLLTLRKSPGDFDKYQHLKTTAIEMCY